ncbi:Eukaryotic translation initiation factor 2 subunit 1 [Gurleya vavrai]
MQSYSHSFYPSQYPSTNEIVMCKITKITDLGVYVELLEYNNIEGLIVVSELSKKKIKSIASLVKIGRSEAAMVLRVDTVKGYIDLSRKKVSVDDSKECGKKYMQNKMAHGVMIMESNKRKVSINDLYDLYFEKVKEDCLYNYFKKVMKNEIEDEICESVKKKFNAARFKIRGDVDVTSYNIGVFAVKEALNCGLIDSKINISLIKTPTYSLTYLTGDRDDGLKIVKEAISKIKDSIENSGGVFKMNGEIEVVGERGNIDELCERLEEMENEIDE